MRDLQTQNVSSKFVHHVHCSRCGTQCSGVDPELGLVVRAWVECPECLEQHEAERDRLVQALREIVALDLKKDERGRDDFYSGPDRFFRAHKLARNALAVLQASGTPAE